MVVGIVWTVIWVIVHLAIFCQRHLQTFETGPLRLQVFCLKTGDFDIIDVRMKPEIVGVILWKTLNTG